MARRISKTDVNDLIKILNEAYAEEWLAYYQYFIGAKLAEGILRPNVVAEFEEHAKEQIRLLNFWHRTKRLRKHLSRERPICKQRRHLM